MLNRDFANLTNVEDPWVYPGPPDPKASLDLMVFLDPKVSLDKMEHPENKAPSDHLDVKESKEK